MERFKTKMIRDIINYGKTLKEKGIFNKYCMIFFKVKNKSYWKQKYGTETVHSLGMNIYDMLLSNTDEEEIICNYFPGAYIALIKKDKLNKMINKFSKGIQNKKLCIEELLFLKIAYTFIETNNEVEDVLDNVIIGMEKIINDESKPIINYNQEIEQQISDDEKIFIVFNNSIDNNEFIPYYQPKVYSVDNSLCGAEALVRWKHNNNLILPNTFLPILESTGNISKLDLYMLERVCKDIKYWLEHGYDPVKISVNISRVNFEEKNFIKKLINILSVYNTSAKYIEFEITETVNNYEIKKIQNFIKIMHENSIEVSMDDFGSGYSSIATLTNLDFDTIKIDKKLINNLDNKKTYTILKMFSSLCKQLGIKVVVEGVENEKQVKILNAIGYNYIQGYFYDKPLEKEEFTKRLSKTI